MTFTNNLLPTQPKSFARIINVWPMSDHLMSGLYKCEITYLAPASISCPVVVTITRLVLVSPPSDVRLYHGAADVTNTSLGPVQEDSEVSEQ